MSVQKLRAAAQEIFMAGVAAADPFIAVKKALRDAPIKLKEQESLVVVSIGKAAIKMALAARDLLPDAAQVLVVTNYENATEVQGATVFAAGHPVPDENGLIAANAIIDVLQAADEKTKVLCLISGGASALVPAPVSGISLADKAKVSEILLGSGADIEAMNLVRQQLSKLKGGGLARIATPAMTRSLILSDVIGDDPRAIASGPTADPLGTKSDAVDILRQLKIWDDLHATVRHHLSKPNAVFDKLTVENRIVGSNRLSVEAMRAIALDACLISEPLIGDVGEAAKSIVLAVLQSDKKVILFGGETTVTLQGNGLGGRNQELALRVALAAKDAGLSGPWAFLSGGTDGRDGPCDAAGGLVDFTTLDRMRDSGLNINDLLNNNDSYHALAPVGDLLMTGATGTNVADLQVFIRE